MTKEVREILVRPKRIIVILFFLFGSFLWADTQRLRFEDMSVTELVDLLETATVHEKQAIVDRLLDDVPAATNVLRSKLLTGSDRQKMFACSFMGLVRDRGSIVNLTQAIDDANPKVATRAILTLADFDKGQILQKVKKKLGKTNNRAVLKSGLVYIGKTGSAKDITVLKSYLFYSDESVRVDAAGAMALLGNASGLQILLDGVDSDNPAVQKEATYLLGFLNVPAATERLEQILATPEGRWKSYAGIALLQQTLNGKNDNEKLQLLIDVVASEKNTRVFKWAAEQLSNLNTPQSRQILQEVAELQGPLGRQARRLLKARRAD